MISTILKSIRPGLLSVLVLSTALGGCSNRVATYPASGIFHFDDGEPVRTGVAEFRSENGICARAKLDATGSFTLGTYADADGAPAGAYKVIVVQYFDAPPRRHVHTHSEHDDHDEHNVDANGHGTDARVATKFSDYATSPLRVTVSPVEPNQFDLVVTHPAGSVARSK